MRRIPLRRPSPAMVVAIIALVVSLAGGAYAAKKIGTKQLKKGAVTTKKLAVGERSQGYVYFNGGKVPLPASTETDVTPALSLPDGNFFVTAQVGIDADAEETVECIIYDGDAPVSRASTALPALGGFFTGTLTLTGPVNGGQIFFTCETDNASTARHRMITAVRVGTLFTQ